MVILVKLLEMLAFIVELAHLHLHALALDFKMVLLIEALSRGKKLFKMSVQKKRVDNDQAMAGIQIQFIDKIHTNLEIRIMDGALKRYKTHTNLEIRITDGANKTQTSKMAAKIIKI